MSGGSRRPAVWRTWTPDVASVYGGYGPEDDNGLESINALIEERCAKVDHWQNSSQRQRWLATALLDIERVYAR